jgi:hypothetical protein
VGVALCGLHCTAAGPGAILLRLTIIGRAAQVAGTSHVIARTRIHVMSVAALFRVLLRMSRSLVPTLAFAI